MTLVLATAPLLVGGCEDGERNGPREVEVIVDELGMVHIYGKTDQDVFWAAGYQMASDRLLQMDLVRRRALGRRAEIMGPDLAEDDQLMRVFDFAKLGEADAASIAESNPEELALVEAWVEGVNARLAEVEAGDVTTPYGLGAAGYDYLPEPWTVEEVFATAKLFMFGNSNSLEYDFLATILNTLNPDNFAALDIVRQSDPAFILPPADRPSAAKHAAPRPSGSQLSPASAARAEMARQLLSDPEAQHRLASFFRFLHDQSVTGSNNWAIAGKLTASGRPIIANDPHQPIDSPSVLYAMHLDSKSRGRGSINAAGFGFAGTPGVQLGHNEHIHWAATTAFADVMDLWNVRRDGESIQVGNETVALTMRVETIVVAGGDDVELEVWEAGEHGVLLPDFIFESFGLPKAIFTGDSTRDVLVNWAGFRETTEVPAFIAAARSKNVDEYREATRLMQVGGFNWMAADAQSIVYTPQMLIPDRGDPSARQMPYVMLDGDDPGNYWTRGFLPEDKLPYAKNPKRGWIASANNDPFGFTENGDVHDDPWYYGALFAPGFRAARIEAELTRLAQAGSIDVEQMKTLQTDVHPAYADRLLPHLENAWAAATDPGAPAELVAFADDPRLGVLIDRLRAWDRELTLDASDAVVFHVWSHVLAGDVTRDELSLAFEAVFAAQPGYPLKVLVNAYDDILPESDAVIGDDGRDVLALQAMVKTANWLEAQFGGIDAANYTWADRHGTRFDNQLDRVDQGWVPTRGGDHTVDVSDSPFFEAGSATKIAERWDSTSGPVFRFVTTFDDEGTPVAVVNYPPGNQEDPDAPNFSNTLQDWVDGVYAPMPFKREDVEAAEVDRHTITVQPSRD